MTRPSGARRIRARLRDTPALHLADQVLSSGSNFLAVVVVARLATPGQFGIFSIFLVTYFVASGFNRAVPHAIAMTLAWDDERSRSGYFFVPALTLGLAASVVLLAAFAVIGRSWLALPLLLLPLVLQDAVRMHAFAVHMPLVALLSDGTWLLVEAVGFGIVTTALSAALVWGVGGLCALVVTRPWRIRIRVQRRPVRADAVSAGLEWATLAGLGFLTPVLATPFIKVVGVGALQGTNVLRGPIILLLQGLLVHRMAGPPITPQTCVREAARLSRTTLSATFVCVPPLLLLRELYGPRLLGSTWPQVEPLVVPTLLTMVVGSVAFGPATVARKMGCFALSAKLQGALAPLFVALPVAGAAAAGTRGFVYATAASYALFSATWWIVLPKVAARSVQRSDLAVT